MGATVAVIPVMGVVGPPIVGLLADSIGLRGALLRVACLGSFLAFALLAVAGIAHLPLDFFEILVVVLVFAAFRAPMLLLADVVAMEAEHDTGASYGRTRLWGSVGFLVASVGGGRYVDPDSPAALPAAVAASLLLALLTALAVPGQGWPGRRLSPLHLQGVRPPRDAPPRRPLVRRERPLPPLRRRVRGRAGDLQPRDVLLPLPRGSRRIECLHRRRVGRRRGGRDPHDGRRGPAHRPLRRAAPDGARALGGRAPLRAPLDAAHAPRPHGRGGAPLALGRALLDLRALVPQAADAGALLRDRSGGLLRRGRGGHRSPGCSCGAGCTATLGGGGTFGAAAVVAASRGAREEQSPTREPHAAHRPALGGCRRAPPRRSCRRRWPGG